MGKSSRSSGGSRSRHKPSNIRYDVLIVKLFRAQDLYPKDASGASDPFAKIYCGSLPFQKSATIYKNLNPVWDETFQFVLKDKQGKAVQPPSTIRIELWDHDTLNNDFQGQCDVSVSEASHRDARYRKFWVPLVGKKNREDPKITGKVELSMYWEKEVLSDDFRAVEEFGMRDGRGDYAGRPRDDRLGDSRVLESSDATRGRRIDDRGGRYPDDGRYNDGSRGGRYYDDRDRGRGRDNYYGPPSPSRRDDGYGSPSRYRDDGYHRDARYASYSARPRRLPMEENSSDNAYYSRDQVNELTDRFIMRIQQNIRQSRRMVGGPRAPMMPPHPGMI